LQSKPGDLYIVPSESIMRASNPETFSSTLLLIIRGLTNKAVENISAKTHSLCVTYTAKTLSSALFSLELMR